MPQPQRERRLPPAGRRRPARVDRLQAHDPPDPHGRGAHAGLHDLRVRHAPQRQQLQRRPLPGRPPRLRRSATSTEPSRSARTRRRDCSPTQTLRDWYTPMQHNAAACLGCHDTQPAAAHAYVMTAPVRRSLRRLPRRRTPTSRSTRFTLGRSGRKTAPPFKGRRQGVKRRPATPSIAPRGAGDRPAPRRRERRRGAGSHTHTGGSAAAHSAPPATAASSSETKCADCHGDIVQAFAQNPHARLLAARARSRTPTTFCATLPRRRREAHGGGRRQDAHLGAEGRGRRAGVRFLPRERQGLLERRTRTPSPRASSSR